MHCYLMIDVCKMQEATEKRTCIGIHTYNIKRKVNLNIKIQILNLTQNCFFAELHSPNSHSTFNSTFVPGKLIPWDLQSIRNIWGGIRFSCYWEQSCVLLQMFSPYLSDGMIIFSNLFCNPICHYKKKITKADKDISSFFSSEALQSFHTNNCRVLCFIISAHSKFKASILLSSH